MLHFGWEQPHATLPQLNRCKRMGTVLSIWEDLLAQLLPAHHGSAHGIAGRGLAAPEGSYSPLQGDDRAVYAHPRGIIHPFEPTGKSPMCSSMWPSWFVRAGSPPASHRGGCQLVGACAETADGAGSSTPRPFPPS